MAAAISPSLSLRPRSQPLILSWSSFAASAGRRQLAFAASAAENRTAVEASSSLEAVALESSAGVVRIFYGGINFQDLSSVDILIGDQCVYEGLIFPHRFVGRKAIMEFFGKTSRAQTPICDQ